MTKSELINEILSEWAYRVEDGQPNPNNKMHLAELSIVLSEMGLLEIKDELFENLKEDDKQFSNPILNKSIKYKNEKGEDKEGIVGNLLRLPKENPGRVAAEKMLPADAAEKDAAMKDLGSEKDGKSGAKKPEEEKPEDGKEKGGGEDEKMKQAQAMFDPKVDPAMAARLDKEKEMQAKFADDAKKAQNDFKAQADKAQSDFKAQSGDKVEKVKAKGYDLYKLSLNDKELKAEEDKERNAVADARERGDEKGVAANSLKYTQTRIARAKKEGDSEAEKMWSDEYVNKRAEYEKQYGKPEDEFDLSKDKEKSAESEKEFKPIEAVDVNKEMPQADPETFGAGSDIPDGIEPEKLEQFNTDINKVAQKVATAKANGEKAPDINLCDVTVPGTNLYCDDNLGIPRDKMPQFKGKAVPGSRAADMPLDKDGEVDTEPVFKKMLEEKGIKTLQTEVPADKLKATQSELGGDKVIGMMGALEKDPNHPSITAPIYVSRDGFVIDGHHRWAAIVAYNAQNPNKQIPMKTTVIDMDIKDAIPMCNKFAKDIGIAAKKQGETTGKAATQPTSAPDGKINNSAKKAIDRIKDGVKKFKEDETEFFNKKVHKGNSPERRSFGEAFKHKAKGAWEAIKHGTEHEVHLFKEAGSGVKNFFSGGKVSESEKKALIGVAKKVAVAAAFGAAGGGLAHGALAFGKHVMMEFIPHVVGETVAVGAGKAALFAGAEDDDADMMKFMEIISKKLESEDIPDEIMADAIESYNENKKPKMTDENIDLANELMLEMIYGFIAEAGYPKADDGKFWVKSKANNSVYKVITPQPSKHAIPTKGDIKKAASDTKATKTPAASAKPVVKKTVAKSTPTKNEPVAGAGLFKDKESKKRLDKEKNINTNTAPKPPKSEIPFKASKRELARKYYDNKQLLGVVKAGLIPTKEKKLKGTGVFDPSESQLKALQYVTEQQLKDPNWRLPIPKFEVSEKEVDGAIEIMEKELGDSFKDIKQQITKSGGVDPEFTKGTKPGTPGYERFRSLIRLYLSTGGRSTITGQIVPFNQMQLDHHIPYSSANQIVRDKEQAGIKTSLIEERKRLDSPENWDLMETELNQLKKELVGNKLLERINKKLSMSPDEKELKQLENEVKNIRKTKLREYFRNSFKNGDFSSLNEETIAKMNDEERDAVVLAWNFWHPSIREYEEFQKANPKYGDILKKSGLEIPPKKNNPYHIGRFAGSSDNSRGVGRGLPIKGQTQIDAIKNTLKSAGVKMATKKQLDKTNDILDNARKYIETHTKSSKEKIAKIKAARKVKK